MKYKLIITDVDGTLVDDKQKILPINYETILQFQNQGGIITLATGRSEISANNFLVKLNINAPAILYNGAAIYDTCTKTFIWEKFLKVEVVRLVMETIKNYHKISPILYPINSKQPITREIDDAILDYMKKDNVKCITIDYENIIHIPIRKILLIGTSDLLLSFLENLKIKTGESYSVNCVKSQENYLEFLPEGVSKGKALNILVKRLGITLDEVIAIGDNLNDLEMIEMAGIGAAVANAHPKLKEKAKYVSSLTNEEGAVAEIIKKFCLVS
ncbi:MAG TPA: HAD family phosphatase [Clostridia bacterium]|nr:HAD family phosphatase [Clostridia bacterium]